MKLPVLVISLFFSFVLSAQTWTNPGATWYYDYPYSDANGQQMGYCKVERTGDTIVSGHLCDKYAVSTVTDPALGQTSEANSFFTYKSNDSVFVSSPYFPWWGTTFGLLYVFNLPAGTHFSSWTGANYYIDSSLTSGLVEPALAVSYASIPWCDKQTWFMDKVGCELFLFNTGDCLNPQYWGGIHLRCYYDGLGNYYNTHRVPYCDYTSKTTEDGIQVLMDPYGITVVSPSIRTGSVVQVYDAAGRLVKKEQYNSVADNHTVFMPLLSQQSGVYYVQIVNGDKSAGKKFLLAGMD